MPRTRFLTIDETDGSVWSIPMDSMVLETTPPPVLYESWRKHVEKASRDAYAFVCSESIAQLNLEEGVSTPIAVGINFAFVSRDSKNVVLASGLNFEYAFWADFGNSFVFPFSYQRHCQYSAQTPFVLAGRTPLEAPDVHSKESALRRPSPAMILNAVKIPVERYATMLSASEREFVATTPVAPYLFRDCTINLEHYWKATKLHKEHSPRRIAFKSQIKRDAERRRLMDVRVLYDRTAENPLAQKIVLRNAKIGVAALQSLQSNTLAVQGASASRVRLFDTDDAADDAADDATNDATNDATHTLSLPDELSCKILEHAVSAILAMPNARASIRAFGALRLVSYRVCSEVTTFANERVFSAQRELGNFVLHGTVRRPLAELRCWTYSELGVTPTLLVRDDESFCHDSNHDSNHSNHSTQIDAPPCLRLLRARFFSKTGEVVVRARARVHSRDARGAQEVRGVRGVREVREVRGAPKPNDDRCAQLLSKVMRADMD